MELRHLRYFVAIADLGSISEAGRRLHVSQSTISEQVADLEAEVGGSLFDRRAGRVRLTPQGIIFLTEARKTLLAAERTVDVTRRSLAGKLGTLSIGFFLWGVGGFFPRLIREYRRLHPGVRLSLVELDTVGQMEALAAGKIDFGFTRPLLPPFDRMFESELLYEDPIVVVMPRDHELSRGRLRMEDLASERFVLCERRVTPALFDGILGLCTGAGFSPEIVNTSATWAGVLTLVESGEGVALVPAGVRHLRTRGVLFRRLQPETVRVGMSLAWRPESQSILHQDFLRLVRTQRGKMSGLRRGGMSVVR